MVTIKSQILKYIALFISGTLVSMGFPGFEFPTLGIGIVLPFSLIPLFLILETLPKQRSANSNLKKHYATFTPNQRSLHAFFAIWFFGFVVQLFAFFWITSPMIYFSSLKPYAAYPMFVGISAVTSLYFPFIFSPLILKTWITTRHPTRNFPITALAMCFVFMEIIAPRFFNWTFGSLMHSEIYVNQLSSIFGFNIISFFIFFTSLSLAKAVLKFTKDKGLFIYTIVINCLVWSSVITFGYFKIQNADTNPENKKTTRIAYVQPNFTFNSIASLPLPAADAQRQNLSRLIEMSHEAIEKAIKKDGRKPDLIVWPESATQSFFLLDAQDVNITKKFAAQTQVPVLVQATKWNPEDIKTLGFEKAPLWSASFLIRPDGSKSKDFEKWIPMPFGESFPFEKYFPYLGNSYRNIFENASKVEPGTSYDALAYTEHEFVAPLICFDSIFQELPRLATTKGSASLFVNQANFVWMVNSNAGFEFSVLNKFRAIENSRGLVMVSNTGPTMAFDPYGRVILQPTKLLTQSTGFIDVPLSKDTTLYSLFANWPLILLGILSYIWLFIAMKKNTYEPRK
ncbi:apolipoprotein N-acyltransferase [Silvanigrella aquatica]|uniref:Apolipoprotein N-acyltransferase n=1 Tax=Silvanigrella aquatica TaxID=1915309 RepID=A0A1L4D258_9BACT|nr:apolipoprotein N-acyltransferase [Silvanigrella aquatica]APJ04277.1 apolipoprotein N-acyltransferase [Silvanigrella aquatica]